LEYARVVASVLRIVRDVDTAEEVVQEAFAQALDRWPADGIPDRPGAWILTTARRRALDRLRRARRADARADALVYETELAAMDDGPDVSEREDIPAHRRGPRAPRSVRGGAPSRRDARRADAARARRARAPRADGTAGLARDGAHRRPGQPRPARRPGPLALGSRTHRPRPRVTRARRQSRERRSPPAPGGDRRVSCACGLVGGNGLGPDRRPLYSARRGRALARGRAEPGRGHRPGARAPGRSRRARRDRRLGAARVPPAARRACRFPPPSRTPGRGGVG